MKARFVIRILFSTWTFLALYYKVSAQSSETVYRRFEWSYRGLRYEMSLNLAQEAYRYYRSLSKTQPYGNYVWEHPDMSYLSAVSERLTSQAKQRGYSADETIEFLAAFVQQGIAYVPDPKGYGHDFPKYPLETLYDRGGDCEDQSILLVALLKSCGVDAVLIGMPGHMAVGIYCPDCLNTVIFDGRKYAFIESTMPYSPIGNVPHQSSGKSVKRIHSKEVAIAGSLGKSFYSPNRTPEFTNVSQAKVIHQGPSNTRVTQSRPIRTIVRQYIGQQHRANTITIQRTCYRTVYSTRSAR